MSKTHAAVRHKSTGLPLVLCSLRGFQHSYASGHVVVTKVFDEIPADDQCKHCRAELDKLRARKARAK